MISIAGFGVATLLMALLPGYQHWVMAAVGLFIALRFVDGIFLGGSTLRLIHWRWRILLERSGAFTARLSLALFL
jgi:hypothetical protein